MSTTVSETDILVSDVDQAFPTLTSALGSYPGARAGADVSTPVRAAIRDVLGLRPRTEDPKAFDAALRAAFRLRHVEGHVVSDYVPRGYAVQADLGAVTGGQASLYRRAQVLRTEMLRILDGLTPLRTDADTDDLEAYRSLVRSAVSAVVDELGAAGGPRLEMVDCYLLALTGAPELGSRTTPDSVGGQLGALRDRFGLVDANVNTVEEEGVRTSFWTLADMAGDLQSSFLAQRDNFGRAAAPGFLGTQLILMSRLMEAAADQVDELEAILDSVLVGLSERRTLVLDEATGLTLDGLLGWLRDFLTREGRAIAQETGRDGIVTALTPTLVTLLRVFQSGLARPIDQRSPGQPGQPAVYLPTSARTTLPAGLHAARSRIAVASLSRLLLQLVRTAQRIGRWPGVVLLDVAVRPVSQRQGAAEVEFRGLNLRPSHVPAFVRPGAKDRLGGQQPLAQADLVLAYRGSTSADGDSITGLFDLAELRGVLPTSELGQGLVFAAQDLPVGVVDGETGQFVVSPQATTWPDLAPGAVPATDDHEATRWASLPTDGLSQSVPAQPVPHDLTPAAERLGTASAVSAGLLDALNQVRALDEGVAATQAELRQQETAVSAATAQLTTAEATRAEADLQLKAAKTAAQGVRTEWLEHAERTRARAAKELTETRTMRNATTKGLTGLRGRVEALLTERAAAQEVVDRLTRATVAAIHQQ